MTPTPPDWNEFIECLNRNQVEYLVVGALALSLHGISRYTGDLDVWIAPTEENRQRVINALGDFGFASLSLRPEDFAPPNEGVQLGIRPVRIDILTVLDGITYPEAYASAEIGQLGAHPVRFLSREMILRNKRALGRPQDLADIARLEELGPLD